jgi:putative sugar O-methyltransferase
MVKLKYLRHPFQTANAAKAMFAARLNMWQFANHGKRRFRNDPRYDLQNVTNGFASRIDETGDDTELLERICTAYIRAMKQQQLAPETYKATDWWQQVRQRSLGPVTKALMTRDVDSLRKMYRNFFRDPCSSGLLGAPYGMSNAYFGGKIKDVYRSFYLSHVLYRLDYWMTLTNGRFALPDLASPRIGNPFGVSIEGTHIRVGSEYAHYCADRIDSLTDSDTAVVAEIGGGFGGMAYYLLRDRGKVKYLDFDIPESIALASYYLLKAFPRLTFLLYGESDLTKEAIARADVVLMPVFELATMPAESVDVAFSSHAMSDISSEALVDYLYNIDRMTRGCFLYIGNSRASESISGLMSQTHDSFELTETRSSGWHSHKVSGAGVGGAAGLAASTMLEQCYRRTAISPGKVTGMNVVRRGHDFYKYR